MKKKDKILTDKCAEPRESWRPLAVAGAPKKPLLGGFLAPVLLTASVVLVFFAGGMHHAEDEVPDADSIEMVIASADEPVPDELAAQTPAVISRWQQAEEASSSSGKLDKAGEEVAAYVSRSYRIPMTEALQMVEWAVEVGAGLDVDPLLILAVVGTESSFNPKARSKAGAEGLMQVMTKVHQEKFKAFGGKAAAFEPYPNMVVGTTILKSLIKRTGSVTKALKWYSGAANHKTDYGYGAKVLKERSRLLVAAKGDSDAAVKLLRAKQNGPAYRKNIVVASLDYSHWSKVAKEAQKSAKARQDLDDADRVLVKEDEEALAEPLSDVASTREAAAKPNVVEAKASASAVEAAESVRTN